MYDNAHRQLVEETVSEGRTPGNGNPDSITSETRQQTWTLDEPGNWDHVTLDLDADDAYTGAGEYDDDRTHNDANELTARDTDDDGTDNFTLTYDANGNLTDDGENYQYVFDAFNRLRKVKNGAKLVAEFRYNGLNHRITAQHDTNLDGVLDGSDTTLHFVYDERWRIVAVFEDDDSAPHEEFVHHNAGADGFGGSSYIDDVVFRDRDADGDFSHTLEERIYYCQNWRHDVVALVNDVGELIEQVRYSPYGVPFGYPTGDTNSDGDWDAGDNLVISSSPSYDVRKDANLDGVVNSSDVTHANSITGGYQTLGRLVLTSTGVENILGYAGYVYDAKLAGAKWHVRNRVFSADLGIWLTRDLWGYVITANLYEYAPSLPQSWVDPFGLYPTRPRGPMKIPFFGWLQSPRGFNPGASGTGGGPGQGIGGGCEGCGPGGPGGPGGLGVPGLPPLAPPDDPMSAAIALPAAAPALPALAPILIPAGIAVGAGVALYFLYDWLTSDSAQPIRGDVCRRLIDDVFAKPARYGKCGFFFLWCEWAQRLPDDDPGKPFWDPPLDGFSCLDCFDDCMATGVWPQVLCPIYGQGPGGRGPRWYEPGEGVPVYPDPF